MWASVGTTILLITVLFYLRKLGFMHPHPPVIIGIAWVLNSLAVRESKHSAATRKDLCLMLDVCEKHVRTVAVVAIFWL